MNMVSGIAVDPQNARYRVPAHSVCNSAVWLNDLAERLICQGQSLNITTKNELGILRSFRSE
jgi:hypothetical protein